MIDANDQARAQIDATNALLRCGIDQLVHGGRVIEALKVLPVASGRKAGRDAFQRVVKARHRLRLGAIASCADEGMGPVQIAEIWGVSRQRVARYISEMEEREAAASA